MFVVSSNTDTLGQDIRGTQKSWKGETKKAEIVPKSKEGWQTLPKLAAENNWIRENLLVPFGGATARVERPTANLVVVFETFKRSHNLKVWLSFAPTRGKIF